MFGIQEFIFSLVIGFNIYLAVKIIKVKDKDSNNFLFATIQLALAWWALFLILIKLTNYNIWVSRLLYIGPVWLPTLLFIYVINYPTRYISKGHKVLKIVNYISFIFSGFFNILLFTNKFFISLDFQTDPVSPVFNNTLYLVYNSFTYTLLLFILIISVIRYKKSKGFIKLQILYFTLGLFISTLGVITINAILPYFHINILRQSSPVVFMIFNLFSFAALKNSRLLSIRTILIDMGKAFVLSSFFFVVIFLVRTLQIKVLNYTFFQKENLILNFVFTTLVAHFVLYYIDPFRKKLGIIVKENRLLLSKLLNRFDKLVKGKKTRQEVKDVFISLFKKEFNNITPHFSSAEEMKASFSELKSESSRLIITQELESTKLKDDLRLNKYAVIVKVQDEYLIIPEKINGGAFTREELDIIENYISKLKLVLDRSKVVEDIERFNKSLTEEISKATKKLKSKVRALEEAQRREKDMIDIMGHELRTPMSIIKGSFYLLKNYLEKLNLEENFESEKIKKVIEYQDRIEENVDREIKLINTLLGATRIDKNQMNLKLEEVDIVDVVEDGIVGQEKLADEKNLNLKFVTPDNVDNFPSVYADRVKIQQVVDNLINNAVKYTKEGSVKVFLEKKGSLAKVRVKDTGVGIKEEDLKRLGKKFFRVNQYTSDGTEKKSATSAMVRPGGTGLGLYVTYGIVKALGGEIDVESTYGEGSTFSFTVPLYKGQKEEKRSEDEDKNVFKRKGLKR